MLKSEGTEDLIRFKGGGDGLLRPDHQFRPDILIEFLIGQIAAADGFLTQCRAVLVSGFGDLGAGVVAKLAVQRRHQHQRVFDALPDIVFARFDADDAIVGEGDGGVAEQLHRLDRKSVV